MLKRLALSSTALTFFLLTADQAAAGPLVGAVIGVFSAVVSGAGVANAIVSLALAAGTTLLQMANTPDKPPPVGMKVQADVGDDQPVSTTIGKFATRGKRKYVGNWGKEDDTPNTYLTEVYEIGSLPVPGLDGLWIDGQKCTILWDEPETLLGRGYPVEEFRDGDDNDYCWVKFYDGSQTAADPYLLRMFENDKDRPWDATMVGRGIPYVIMTYRWQRRLFKGQPKALYEPAPLRLYDIRKDSTQGGNGAHRFGDESTYEPSDNLSVMAYNVIRGLSYKGEWFYGGQDVDARRMPASNWIAAHQEAARVVERPDDKTEPQWRGGYEITGDMTPLAVLEEFRKAQNGRLTDQGGVFKMKNGTFGAPVFSFHDDDIGITDPSGFDPFNSVDQTVNGINGKYPNPKEGWVAKDAPVLRNAAYEALDGKRNLADISFGATSHARQVQQLMRGILEEARRFRRHQIPLPPMAYVLEAGIDVIGWTSPHNGYVNKRFLVVERRGQMGMNQIVTLQEIDPTDYDWVRDMEQTVSDGWVGRLDTPVQPMTGWQVTAGTMSGANGIGRRPTIVVSCTPNLVDVARVLVRVRLKATGEVVFESDQFPYGPSSQWTLTGLWLWPATQYEVQGRLVPFSGRRVADSPWITVTTRNIGFSSEDVLDNAITQAKIVDAAISANKIMDGAVSALKIADKAITENKIAIGAVTKDLIASGAIVADKFAGGIGPVGIITGTTVPATKTLDVITVAGKLYRWNGTKYTADVPAADIAGTISGSQIAEDAIDATKFANGLSPITNISGSTVPTTKSTDVITVAGKLYRWDGSKYTASVPTQDLTGTVTANQIGANAITAGKIAADAITSANIQAGAIKAEQISAGAISTSKLTVMDMSNLVAGELLDPAAWNGGMNTNWALLSSTTSLDEMGRVMIYSGPIVNAGAGDFVSDQYSNRFPVNVGEPLAVSVKVRGYGNARGQFRCEVNWADKDEASLGSQTVDGKTVVFSGSTATTSITAIMNPPASAVSGRLRMRVACDAAGDFVSAILIRNISVRRAASAELIVDGSITGDKITANAISSDKIAANAISADKIQTNAITAGKIAAGSIDTDKLAANAITAEKIDTNAITAQKIAAGAITAVKIGAGAITTDKLDAEAVTAQKIAAGTIGADQIAANAITAKHLVLTDFTNMVPDNALQDPKAWAFGGGALAPVIGEFGTNGPAFRFTANGAAASTSTYIGSAASQDFNVKPGEQYRFGATIDFNTSTSDQGVRIYIDFFNSDGEVVGNAFYSETPAKDTAARNVAATAVVPAAAVKARYYVRRGVPSNGDTSAGTLYVWNPFCYRRANAELIVDGAITADKVATNAITASKIDVTSLSAISATLGNVDISSANIGSLTVGKSNIQSGAVTQVDSYYSSSTLSLTTSSNIQVADVAVTVASGEKVIIFGQFRVDMESSERTSMAARIYRDGSATGMNMEMDCPLLYDKIEGEFNDMDIPARYGWRGQHWVVMLQDTPGTGTFTYTLRAIRGTNGSQEASTNLRFLTAMVLKR